MHNPLTEPGPCLPVNPGLLWLIPARRPVARGGAQTLHSRIGPQPRLRIQ